MLTPNFKITKIFFLTARNMIVLTGNIISGNVENGMSLVSEENDMRVKINSIEMVNSSDNDEQIGLTFIYKDEHELELLKRLEKGNKVVLTY